MKDRVQTDTNQRNHALARVFFVISIILAVFVFARPMVRFDVELDKKKSGNTFVGDEKYIKTLAEMEAIAEGYRESTGAEVWVDEAVTERQNSKGETTSLVTFRVLTGAEKTGLDFLGCALPAGRILWILVICLIIAVVLSLPLSKSEKKEKDVPAWMKTLRSFAIVGAVIAMALVPVFMMSVTRTYNRTTKLYIAELKGEEALPEFNAAGEFLFPGQDPETYPELLNGINFEGHGSFWILLGAAFLMLCGAVLFRYDQPGKWFAAAGIYLFAIVLSILFLYPYYVMLITGFRSNAESTDMYFLHMFPTEWVWSNLKVIMDRGVLTYLKNSLLLSAGATVIALICGIPAAYALARMKFAGKKLFLGFVIMSQMFSPVVLLVGISQLMKTIHLNNSVVGLMLINAAFNQAFAIWLLRGTFVSISPEMEQAATIDGCTRFQSMIRVLLPMAAPGIVTTLIFIFINAWNEYTISTVLISTVIKKPITVGITQFSSFNMIEWQYLFASSLFATIPVVILFIMIEKHLVSGLTSGGVKG